MESRRKAELEFALAAVREAVGLARRIQSSIGAPGRSRMKSDRSPVTMADYAIQALVGFLLAKAYPEDALVGEESADFLRSPEGRGMLEKICAILQETIPAASPELVPEWIDFGTASCAERYWTLDPIDGTAGFLRGEQYAVALALIVKGEVQLSVLGCPHLRDGCVPDPGGAGSIVAAVKGHGSWHISPEFEDSFRRLRVSSCSDIREARSLCSVDRDHSNRAWVEKVLSGHPGMPAPLELDSMAKYAVVAGGTSDFLTYLPSAAHAGGFGMKVWDVAPGALIVEEAGGKVTDLEGNVPDYSQVRVPLRSGILISNGILHEKLLAAFKAVAV
ncbi:MAG: inositol monophosphatase family protein [Candidatus Omnitrophota bacterium]